MPKATKQLSTFNFELSTPTFLTGATGFIGRQLAERLIAAGADVTAFVLPGEADLLPVGVRAIHGDITMPETVAEALAATQPGLIIHLAAIGITNPDLPFAAACAVNVGGVINVLDAVRQVKTPKRIVLVGSSYEYGARRADDGLDPFNAYSASKVAAWAFARAAYNAWGAPVVWMRLFQVYGPGQREQALIPAAIQAAVNGADFRMTAGEQQRDFVFVEDVIEGLMAASVAPGIEGRALDVGTGQLHHIRAVVERIWALSGARGRILAGALPYRPGEVPAIPADVDRTRRLTGWEARMELEKGLQKTIDCALERLNVRTLERFTGGMDMADEQTTRQLAEARAEALRREIRDKVAEYYDVAHRPATFTPGETFVNYGGRVYDERELQSAVEAVLDFWLTDGPRVAAFSERLGQYVGLKRILTVNSGSSANLVAMTTLCSRQLEHPLKPGDEVITPAATFPTTVAPIVQNQLMPVFIDCKVGTYNIDVDLLEAALSEKTRAVFVPHILGNPVEMDRVMEFAQAHDLYVIEDTCDALGSRYDGVFCGAFGHLSTFSFYPAHHITTGEGGAVGTNDKTLYHIAHSIRDWGRDCWCDHKSHRDGECRKRFDWEIPGLGEPYDHRYYFTEIGYNLKMTDIQAAIGLPQLDKLPDFVAARRRNFKVLYDGLSRYADYLVLPVWSPKADPAWFAFTIAVREHAPFTRRDLNDYLRERKVETRYLFAGNILHQPGYRNIPHRVATPMPETERVLKSAFFIGVYPGMDDARLAYILQVFEDFFKTRGLQ